MTTQRLISDARRRAKALSRASGRPYQTHLDELAISTGRVDWAAFLADPTALPPEAVDVEAQRIDANAGTQCVEHAAPDADHADDRIRSARAKLASMWLRAGIAAALTLAAALALSRTRVVTFGIDALGPDAVTTGIASVVLIAIAVLGVPALAGVAVATSWTLHRRDTESPSRTALAGLWRVVCARSAAAVAVPTAFTFLLPLVSMSVPLEAVRSYTSDHASARTVEVRELHRSVALVALSPDGPMGRRLTLAMIDQRLSPPYLRGVIRGDAYGPSLRRAFVRDGVMRTVGTLDCVDRRYRIARFQTAPSLVAPASADVANPRIRSRGVHLSGAVIDEACQGS